MSGLMLLLALPAVALGWNLAASVPRSGRLASEEAPPIVSLSAQLEPIAGLRIDAEVDEPVMVQTAGYVLPGLSDTSQEDHRDAGR